MLEGSTLSRLPCPKPPKLEENSRSLAVPAAGISRAIYFSSSETLNGGTCTVQRLHLARRQGQLRLRRLRCPTLILGPLCAFGGLLMGFVTREKSPALEIGGWALTYFGITSLLMSLLPTDVRCVPLTVALLAFPISTLFFVYRAWILVRYIKMVTSQDCHFVEDFDERDIPCSFIVFEAILVICGALIMLVICCFLIKWLHKKLVAQRLLLKLWRVLSVVFLLQGCISICRCFSRFYTTRINSGVKFFVFAFVNFLFLAVASRYDLIVKVQSWLMSRGEAATAAAGISELLGERDPEYVLAHARESFLCIKADQLSYEDMLENSPNPALAELTHKERLGHADAFVSHSWHDDPTLKWNALQSWCSNFRQMHMGVEPTLWIDKYCIDQNNIEQSLACLPIYLAGCKRLLILCGPTYLSRLWCVIEIFVFLEMGGKHCNLDVLFLENETRKPERPRLPPSSTHTSSTHTLGAVTPSHTLKASMTQTTTLGSTLGVATNCFSIDTSVSLGATLHRFDSRNALCFKDEDTVRLGAVLQMSGAAKVNKLVRDVFVSKLAEARSAYNLRQEEREAENRYAA